MNRLLLPGEKPPKERGRFSRYCEGPEDGFADLIVWIREWLRRWSERRKTKAKL